MLAYERRVVDALIGSDDPVRRQAIGDHVGATLAAMPEHLRAGIAGETVLLATWSAARRRGRALDPVDEVGWLDGHPIGLVRQWIRALRSLVLLAENEMLDADSPGGGDTGETTDDTTSPGATLGLAGAPR